MLEAGEQLGFSVTFQNYEGADYYQRFMRDFLDTYGITHGGFRRIAQELYDEMLEWTGPQFPSLFSHFRFIILKKC